MAGRAAGAGRMAIVAAFVAIPFAVHAATVTPRWAGLAPAITTVELVILAIAAAACRAGKARWLISGAALALAAALGWAEAAGVNLSALPGVPHTAAYLALLVTFGVSLTVGHTPVITRLATIVRGKLPDELKVYSRRVTVLWFFFFAAQLVLSLTLYLSAPLAVWSFFINVLNGPLVVAVFLAEYVYRVIRFRKYGPTHFSAMMAAIAGTARGSSGQAGAS